MFLNYKIREDYRKETSFVNMKVNKTLCRNYTHTDDIIKSIFSSENRKRLIEVFFPFHRRGENSYMCNCIMMIMLQRTLNKSRIK